MEFLRSEREPGAATARTIRQTEDSTTQVPIRTLINKMREEIKVGQQKEESNRKTKNIKWPWKWKRTAARSKKLRDHVLVMYLNIKGEVEQPFTTPLYSGNMVIIRHKVYEVDPRAFWTIKFGTKIYKLLIFKEIDRRPVSNLDYSEIRARGDATDADELLIKAALKAQTVSIPKGMSKAVIIVVVIAIIAAVAFFFIKG